MEIAIIVLGLIVLAQAVERYFFAKELYRQLENATKAVLSRNIEEYLRATKDKKETKEKQPETEEILLNQASDKEFDQHIKNIVS